MDERGPFKEKEIFSKEYGSDGEVHILAKVYKEKVFLCQYDTTADVRDLIFQHTKVNLQPMI